MNRQAGVIFCEYFDAFERALMDDDWSPVARCFADDARYRVENVPFACELAGPEAIVRGLQKSVSHFDRCMDGRLLEILSITRLAPHRIQVELVTGYDRGGQALRGLVSCEVETDGAKIHRLTDRYEPAFMAGAMQWLGAHAADLDPSYVP